jgi:transcription antitermination factor NusG
MPGGASITDLQEPKWYALFVRARQEKRIAGHLDGRNVQHFLPCYPSVRQWKDRRVVLTVPLFPGYVFVHLPLTERLKVLTIPNVVSLVGSKQCAAVISDEEIAWIMSGTNLGTAQPHPFLTVGQRVRITHGLMMGLEGILVRQQNSTRVVVSVNSIASSFVINVDANSVQPSD